MYVYMYISIIKVILTLFQLLFKPLKRKYSVLKHFAQVRRGREGHNHAVRSTREHEEAKNQDRHLEVTGHAMKPSQPSTAMVEITESSNCDEPIWNVLEVLSS